MFYCIGIRFYTYEGVVEFAKKQLSTMGAYAPTNLLELFTKQIGTSYSNSYKVILEEPEYCMFFDRVEVSYERTVVVFSGLNSWGKPFELTMVLYFFEEEWHLCCENDWKEYFGKKWEASMEISIMEEEEAVI